MSWETLDPRHGRLRMERVLQHVSPGGRHLDVGTGNGDGTLLLRGHARCVGLEYGPKSAAIAATKGCTVVQGDVRSAPFASMSFDSITCLDVLEHVPRPQEALAEMARLLVPGGCLVLQTPNRELLKERVLRLVRALGYPQKQPYDLPLGLADLRRLVGSSGLALIEERWMPCWDDRAWVRPFSRSRLFLCAKTR